MEKSFVHVLNFIYITFFSQYDINVNSVYFLQKIKVPFLVALTLHTAFKK